VIRDLAEVESFLANGIVEAKGERPEESVSARNPLSRKRVS
jgi:hypothetical protein